MEKSEIESAIEAGLLLGEIKQTQSGSEFTVLPSNARVHDLEGLLDNPRRRRGSVNLVDLDSLIRYVKLFADTRTRIFADISQQDGSASFTAVLNYHEGGKDGNANWGDHRATYTATRTPEWLAWSGSNKKPMSQSTFASFVEDNIADIVEPSGAVMLEISRTLEAKRSVEFKSGVRLENGDHQIKFVSETTGRAGGNGELEIPATFALGIAPYIGGPAYKIQARLRYRITEGHLSLWYELVNPHKVIESATKEIVETIKQETEQEAFMGKAPSL